MLDAAEPPPGASCLRQVELHSRHLKPLVDPSARAGRMQLTIERVAADGRSETRKTMSTVNSTPRSRSLLLIVSKVIEETDDARSLVFEVPNELRDRFMYKPGQFLTLRIPSTRTGSVARCYSLASSPHMDVEPKVTVKRTVDGYGSNWLCDNVRVGDTIEVLPPAGVFTPTHLNHDFLLWAAGSGITPVMSILKSALAAGVGRVTLIYANRDERSVIFSDELRCLAGRYPERLTVIHWLESLQGLPSAAQFVAFASPFVDHESFLCGPGPFMDTVVQALSAAGVPGNRVHSELFTSLTGDPFAEVVVEQPPNGDEADTARAEIELDGQRHVLHWPRTQTLVDAMIAQGIDVPYSCREGQCGSCACTLLAGEIERGNAAILEQEDIEAGVILGCQARPVGDHIRIEF
jgi:3-ketosteroid 9alpha-monooxygenase subunit B